MIYCLCPLGSVHSQQATNSAYYGLSGYSGYPNGSAQLVGANVSLSLSFRFCLRDGILLHTTDSTGALYFSVGVYNSHFVVQFDTGEGLREVRWDRSQCPHSQSVTLQHLDLLLSRIIYHQHIDQHCLFLNHTHFPFFLSLLRFSLVATHWTQTYGTRQHLETLHWVTRELCSRLTTTKCYSFQESLQGSTLISLMDPSTLEAIPPSIQFKYVCIQMK